MSTHNICFRREIRKILCGYPLLSVAMLFTSVLKLGSCRPTPVIHSKAVLSLWYFLLNIL